MNATESFGFALIATSAALLAWHWRQRSDLAAARHRDPAAAAFEILQLRRRSVASALIGVVGAAMTLVERVPRTPEAMTSYLFSLLIGGASIFAIAVVDWRAMRKRRDREQLELLANELRQLQARTQEREAD